MIKKIICLGVVLIMIVVGFTACNKNDDEKAGKALNFNVGYNQRHYSWKELSDYELPDCNLNKKVNSVEALVNLSNENNYSFFNENDTKYNSDLGQKIRQYDELYFQKNSLILVLYFESAGNDPAKIDSVYIEDDKLRVTMSIPEAQSVNDGEAIYAVNDVETIYVFIIEVNKKDVEGADKVELVQIRKGEREDYL